MSQVLPQLLKELQDNPQYLTLARNLLAAKPVQEALPAAPRTASHLQETRLVQTLTPDWGTIRDVQYPGAWGRYVSVGRYPSYFSVTCLDYAHEVESIWADYYDHRTEMVVSFAAGDTERSSLDALMRTSTPDDTFDVGPVGGLLSAARTHAKPLVRALDVAALYRGKPRMVMWAANGAKRKQRLSVLAKAWGFQPAEEIEGARIYRREVE